MEGTQMAEVEVTRISSRGQLVIPKKIRKKLTWSQGDHLVVEVKDDQVILRKLSMDDILLEAEKDWEEGKPVLLRPRKE